MLRVQWYVSAFPAIAILVTVLAVSLVGQASTTRSTRDSRADEPATIPRRRKRAPSANADRPYALQNVTLSLAANEILCVVAKAAPANP